jgi:hypothetical protein
MKRNRAESAERRRIVPDSPQNKAYPQYGFGLYARTAPAQARAVSVFGFSQDGGDRDCGGELYARRGGAGWGKHGAGASTAGVRAGAVRYGRTGADLTAGEAAQQFRPLFGHSGRERRKQHYITRMGGGPEQRAMDAEGRLRPCAPTARCGDLAEEPHPYQA